MSEKTQENNNFPVKERFEFVLTINDFIICQRYFKINNFQERSLASVNLAEAIRDCYEMIDNDLKEKTNIYNYLTAPQVFKDKEEMDWWIEKQPFKLDVPSFIVLRKDEEGKSGVYLWNGEGVTEYTRPFNKNAYVGEGNETPSVLKFSFLDDGREIRSMSWDANVYPGFVRSNIDISNSKNKYTQPDNYSPYEAFIINKFNESQVDLIPRIIRRIGYACSAENLRYFTKLRYGNKFYDLNTNNQVPPAV